jgi:hypothetical protein
LAPEISLLHERVLPSPLTCLECRTVWLTIGEKMLRAATVPAFLLREQTVAVELAIDRVSGTAVRDR